MKQFEKKKLKYKIKKELNINKMFAQTLKIQN